MQIGVTAQRREVQDRAQLDSRERGLRLAASAGESANLDILRAIAVLLVFASHYYDIKTGAGKLGSIEWHLGQLGVLIFFVHTCLVLMFSLERSRLEGDHLFARFYIRRAFRLYPLSIACVLFAYFFDARWDHSNLWPNLTLTRYLFFRTDPSSPPLITPIWSLPLEVEMYVVLPMLFLWLRNRAVRLMGIIWGVSVALACLQPRLGDRLMIFLYAPCFLGGVMAWLLLRGRERRLLPGRLWPAGIAVVSMVAIMTNQRLQPIGIAAFGMCLGLIVPFFREITSTKLKIAAKIVARYSYGIYLSHFAIMIYVLNSNTLRHPYFKLIPPMPHIAHYARPIDAVLVCSLTAGISFLLYHVIEEPGIRLGRMIAKSFASGDTRESICPASGALEESKLR